MRRSPSRGLTRMRSYRMFLEEILLAWDKYQAWVFEIDGHFGRLNDQLAGERFRGQIAPCAFEPQSPYVTEAAMLAFRNHLILHHAIREPLTRLLDGDETLAVERLGEAGGEDDHHHHGGPPPVQQERELVLEASTPSRRLGVDEALPL
jgi:hypothetical protein